MIHSSRWPAAIMGMAVPMARLARAAGKGAPPDPVAQKKNSDLTNWFYITWAVVLFVLMTFTVVTKAHRFIRKVSGISDDRQAIFGHRSSIWGFVRRQLIDSPLFRTRHHREFQINAVVNMGTLPSRFQTIFLFLYLAFQTIFILYGMDLSAPSAAIVNKMISRTGVLAVINMLPLFVLAARNNPFIPLCDIPFDTFNLIHRWMGRMAACMAIIHAFCWMGLKVSSSPTGWTDIKVAINTSDFIKTGFVAFICFSAILVSSPSALRHAFYETFLHIHILAAAVSIVGLWVHLKRFPVMKAILRVVVAIWVTDRALRLARVIYYNIRSARSVTKARIEVLPGEAVRVTCSLVRSWAFRPGQHAYLYVPAVGAWTSHPLSIAWSTAEPITTGGSIDHEKGLSPRMSPSPKVDSGEISFIVKRRTGFTDALYRKAVKSATGVVEVSALVEGPYGSQDLRSFGTVILFAAGVGITHQIPHIRDLVAAYHMGVCATRRVLLVWCIQEQEQLEWVRAWMTEILAMPQRREVLRMQLYVTRPIRAQEIHSPSSSVQMYPGRPKIRQIVSTEVDDSIGAVGVSCCGVGAMADEIRSACREHMSDRAVSFMEESFTW